MSKTCIIVGASHAAAQLAPSLRQQGWDGRILVIGDEEYVPYHRPPLSKALLSGEKDIDDILIRKQAIYEKNNIEFMLGRRVASIDRADNKVELSNGEHINYDKLAICTGARVRKVLLPGTELQGVHYLRDISDVSKIKQEIGENKSVVIVGGGYIGLETASVLTRLCRKVTVLEMESRILARVTAPELSEFYSRVHAEEGVEIKTGVAVSGFEGVDHVSRVVCADGSEYEADVVIIGVGVVPNVELAGDAGLDVENGIVVDEYCRTSDPDIFAAGDCSNHPNAHYDRRLRLESVPNATEQGTITAASICGKTDKAYDKLPWFWSDQYDLKLQIAGLSQGFDQVVIRGDRSTGRSFVAFYLKDGELISADCVNRPQEFMVSKRLIAEGIPVDSQRLADEGISPKEFLAG